MEKKSIKLKTGSMVQKIHAYLNAGNSLTQLQTIDKMTSPIGQTWSLAQRMNDLKHKFAEAGMPCPLKTLNRRRAGKPPYAEYYFEGVGCPVEEEAKQLEKKAS